jgi:hypothetical protein
MRVKQSPITEFRAVKEGQLITCVGLVQEDSDSKGALSQELKA